jgi:hypothetical protein
MDPDVSAGLSSGDEPQVELAIVEPVAAEVVDDPAVPRLRARHPAVHAGDKVAVPHLGVAVGAEGEFSGLRGA